MRTAHTVATTGIQSNALDKARPEATDDYRLGLNTSFGVAAPEAPEQAEWLRLTIPHCFRAGLDSPDSARLPFRCFKLFALLRIMHVTFAAALSA